MKALQMTYSIPRYIAAKAIGGLHRGVYTSPLALLRYGETEKPALPGEDWARVQVRYGGICGSDLHTILLQSSPALAPFVSFPFTLGHEFVGQVSECGPAVRGFGVGDRVVVDPLLPCATRGIANPCRPCRDGQYSLCENFANGSLPAGLSIGHCRATGGGWGESLVAHHSQLIHVPDQVSDESAVLVEPLAVAIHAVKHRLPKDSERVIIIGTGTIGLCILAALRALGCRAHVVALYRHPYQAALARRFGADEVVQARGQEHYRTIAEAVGGRLHYPMLSKPVLVGGADVVYECVGHGDSVDDSIRLARAGGTVILVGLVSMPRDVDWTPIWLNELTLWGSFWASTERVDDGSQRTFQIALDLLAQGKLDLSALVTHRFPLDQYRAALTAVQAKGRHGIVKAVFDFTVSGPQAAQRG